MAEQKRRASDRIADPSYLDGLDSKPLQDLRVMREECKEVERELSFERRLCQARVDILAAEIERRSSGKDDSLIDRLPQILASELGGGDATSLPERAPDLSVPRNADIPRRRVEEIVGEQTLARLPSLQVAEIKGIITSVSDHERSVSARRKAVQDVMDRIQAEIVRRYTSGEADPSAALG
ncbi:MAG: aerial mycelium formation protein [Actinomycetota bacterium]